MRWVAVLFVAVFAGPIACGDSKAPPPPPVRARAVDAATDAAIDAATDAAIADAASVDAANAAAAPSGGAGDLVMTIDDTPHALRFGVADYRSDGLGLLLSSEPVTCEAELASGATAGYTLQLSVPPGPGATYFAGHAISVTMMLEASHEHTDIPGDLARASGVASLPKMLGINGAAGLVTLAKFSGKAHAHVRGSIDGADGSLLGTAGVHGQFDVELCRDLDAPGLRATAPAHPASGHAGAAALVPHTVHAIVGHRAATHDEAIDVALHHRAGSVAAIDELVFYAAANVPCPTDGEFVVGQQRVVVARSIGGTDRERPSLGVAQPTSLIFYTPGGGDFDYDAVWPAWVVITPPLAYTPGAKLHGQLWGASEWFDTIKGDFGGTFDAIVCAPK